LPCPLQPGQASPGGAAAAHASPGHQGRTPSHQPVVKWTTPSTTELERMTRCLAHVHQAPDAWPGHQAKTPSRQTVIK
jgi:hypothetical protein